MDWRRVRVAGIAAAAAGVALGLLLEQPWAWFAEAGAALMPLGRIAIGTLYWGVIPAGLALIAIGTVAPRAFGAAGGPSWSGEVARRLAIGGTAACLAAAVASWALDAWVLSGPEVTIDVVATPGWVAYRLVATALSVVIAPGGAILAALALAPGIAARVPAVERP